MTVNHELGSEDLAGLARENALMKGLLIAAVTASFLSMIFSIGTAVVSASHDSPPGVVSAQAALD